MANKKQKIKVLYQEWHIGKITWYNNVLEEYRLEFNDGTDDYINLNDKETDKKLFDRKISEKLRN